MASNEEEENVMTDLVWGELLLLVAGEDEVEEVSLAERVTALLPLVDTVLNHVLEQLPQNRKVNERSVDDSPKIAPSLSEKQRHQFRGGPAF